MFYPSLICKFTNELSDLVYNYYIAKHNREIAESVSRSIQQILRKEVDLYIEKRKSEFELSFLEIESLLDTLVNLILNELKKSPDLIDEEFVEKLLTFTVDTYEKLLSL